jgi:DNA repair protein RecN (Recombination protein N)
MVYHKTIDLIFFQNTIGPIHNFFLKLLKNLVVKNIVLIEESNIDFNSNLCVLTGETGSGKSILLDALSLAIGVRSSSRLLRNGEKQGSAVATFDIKDNKKCRELLAEMAIDFDDDIILRRILTEDGKSKAFINDVAVSQSFLSKIGEELVEIHGQHDQRGLLNPSFHRDIVDEYGNLREQRKVVAEVYGKMRSTEDNLLELLDRRENIDREIDYLEHILNEIKNMNIQPNEEEELSEKRTLLMNREKILTVMESVKNTLEGQNSVSKAMVSAQGHLSRNINLGNGILAEGENVFEQIIDDFEKGLLEFNEGINKLYRVYNNLDFDGDSLNAVEERLFALRSLCRKLNISSDLIFNYQNDIEEKLNKLKGQNIEIGELEIQTKELKQKYLMEAEKLRIQRKLAAERLKNELTNELIPLRMGTTRFETEFIDLNENAWSISGIDGVRFLVAVNAGANLDDLSKVASGGELSRFMLALKVVLSKVKSVPTLIFDEIDTGVSGAVADAIGERLRKLGESLQVLVITHLPQVASKGDNHLKISKEEKSGKTYTIIEKLDNEARHIEIAKMISGEIVTDEALKVANKLLDSSSRQ